MHAVNFREILDAVSRSSQKISGWWCMHLFIFMIIGAFWQSSFCAGLEGSLHCSSVRSPVSGPWTGSRAGSSGRLSLRGFCIFGSAELLFSPSHDPLSAWAEHTIHPPTQILLYSLLCLELWSLACREPAEKVLPGCLNGTAFSLLHPGTCHNWTSYRIDYFSLPSAMEDLWSTEVV